MTEGIGAADGGLGAAPLLEREGDLAALVAALARARSASGRVALIEGPAGIGKTRLLDEARSHARAVGLEVLTARGGELERGHGFGVVRQLLEDAVARASPGDRGDLLSGAAVFAEPVFNASAAASPAGADSAHTVIHGLYWLVANLAEHSPLLLAVDDLHWCDEASLRFLLYLARRIDGMRVALVFALRTGDLAVDSDLLRALRLEAHPPVLAPRPLSTDATMRLTASRLGRAVPDDLGQACHDATLGNPFLLTELLQRLRDEPAMPDPRAVARAGSERIAAAILLRIGHAGPSAAALVRAISVLGESADLPTAAALAGLEGAAAAELADALAHAEILQPAAPPEPLRFVHPLVRSAVYQDMARSRRALLHARAAHLLAHRRGGSLDAAASHVLLSDPAGEQANVELLRAGARAAMTRGAPEAAAQLLRRAEREPAPEDQRAELLLELGVAASRAGQPDAVDLLREALRATRGQPARALAGLELTFALGVSSGRSEEAIAILESAREGLEDDRLRSLVDARFAMFAICVPSVRSRLSAHLAQARATVERCAPDDVLELLGPLSSELLYTGAAAAEAAQLAERALGGGRLMRRDIESDFDFALAAIDTLICAGRFEAAKHHLDDAVAQARARGSQPALGRVCGFRALVLWRLGALPAAEADAHAALEVDAAWGIPHALATAVRMQVHVERADLDGARAALAALDADPALLEVSPNQIVREAQAALATAEGRPVEALAHLRECALWERTSGLEDVLGPVDWRSPAALAHLALGETAEARELAGRALALARGFGAAPQLAAALRALAIIEGGAEGVALLEEAVAVLEPSGARLDHARALVDHGSLLRRCGRRAAATEQLRAGMELAHRCGAPALVEAAAAELRLAGARPRRIGVSGRAALTPAERRVSDLAAQGMSNKEIAQALFVTLRTVEMHLSNVYRKLAITSREQLPAALGSG